MSDTKESNQKLVPLKVAPHSFSLVPSSLGEAMELGKLIAESDFAPKDYKGKPGNVVIAIQMGCDLGLKPMQALQNIAVINGRPSIFGDAALAIVYAADILEKFEEFYEGTPYEDSYTAVCVAKRKGLAEVRRSFSVSDAKQAKLWGKRGRDGQDTPWITYPARMLRFRARGFTLRDVAADCLLGLILAEEAQDYPTAIDVTPESPALPPNWREYMERLPEELRDRIARAFVELKMAVPADEIEPWHPTGLGLAKLNEFLIGHGTLEEGAEQLLAWCKDEYSRRKTGQPMKPKPDNGKTARGATSPPADSGSHPTPPATRPPTGPPAGRGAESPRQPVESGDFF